MNSEEFKGRDREKQARERQNATIGMGIMGPGAMGGVPGEETKSAGARSSSMSKGSGYNEGGKSKVKLKTAVLQPSMTMSAKP